MPEDRNTKVAVLKVMVLKFNMFTLHVNDTAIVPECCYPEQPGGGSGPKVQYTFMIQCESHCNTEPTNDGERMLSEDQETDSEGFYQTRTKDTSSPLELTSKGGHYCSKEVHPCGPTNENVYVCHYSARDGYQTFCVPEEDTDILAYYPKDHCGPCFGGFAKPVA